METKRLERMEDMLSTLITMVGNINHKQQIMIEEQQIMKEVIQSIKEEQQNMKEEQHAMRNEMENRHNEILVKLNELQKDQDHIWEKTVRNEREIARLKN